MSRPAGKGCCGSIVSLGLAALSLWLIFRTSTPTCSVQDFYLPALNKTLNSTTTSIYFDIELEIPNRNEGIYYNTLDLTFYYKSPENQTYLPVANQTFVGFYQGHKKKARRSGTVEAAGVPWAEALRAVSNGSMLPVFRVGLVTEFRFKVVFWKTKKHGLVVGADVAVNDSGEKDSRKGVRLSSGAPETFSGRTTRPLVVGSILLFGLLSIV